ncbi:c-di-AMP phosphodiesterase, consists of a GGDEF-like and DHH domains [Ruminococcus sp. YE71]|uniref:DHH family phosphoesterase n=1 Tax=unclassified Ruminococcus TaxID=2608920 RepID=UPI0008826D3F|nr:MULTISPECIES: DHH family phosphoesterase [unclassified Ruminococcus]SDA16954.1 c-di-AMP phosphodiesterase, consists of a GGDEF-like and DHH domains [Ruminococcus sp. YE78]SFW25856.1 c-di-AMP phosphodiesterase, consists of a GGDEF-like and DHH domains [Ruminococcus sp. YE71]
MKGTKGVQLLIKLTTAIAAVCSIAAARLLLRSPKTETQGKLLLIISVIVCVMLILEYVFFGSNTRKMIARSAALLNDTEQDSLLNFPAPAVIVDAEGSIVWYNKLFGQKVSAGIEPYGIQVSEMFKLDMEKIYSSEGDTVCHNGHFYTVKAIHTEHEQEGMSMLYFADKTELVELNYECSQSKQSVIIIMIDYYEELISNIRESEKAHILVSIEQLIENFIDGTTGISRRAGNDRFYVILEERYLKPIIEKRFEILEQARKISCGDRRNLTLSIGVGHDAENLAESEKYAKQALDMCLGRGGDQAAVRTVNGYEFYGGLSKGMAKNTRVKSRMAAKAIIDIINLHEQVMVMGHSFADLDAVGAATGMCEAIKCMGKDSYVVVDPNKNLSKLLISYVEDNSIKRYYITPEEALAKSDPNTLVIVCDTHNPDLVESKELLAKCRHTIVIDHHRLLVKAIEPAELFYHEPSASSACEMVAELLEYFPDLKLTEPIAEAVMAGIMLDTKNFVMNTGVRTFEAAAYLRKQGADTVAVKRLFANPLDTYVNKADIINSTEIYRKCAIASAKETFDNIRVASSKAADEMLEIAGVNASFVLYELDGRTNISARSMGKFNVQIIMEALGGGGHHTMAACQMQATKDEAMSKLKEAIDEYIRHN